jgi:hypothetical protein
MAGEGHHPGCREARPKLGDTLAGAGKARLPIPSAWGGAPSSLLRSKRYNPGRGLYRAMSGMGGFETVRLRAP